MQVQEVFENFTSLDKEQGFFNSTNVLLSPSEVFEFCRNPTNIQKVLSDFPEGSQSFLNDLALTTSEKDRGNHFTLKWQNGPKSKLNGSITFQVHEGPGGRGSIIVAEASFDKLNFRHEGPSDLMNMFLKKMKALIETGEMPTIKGQPSGREELKPSLQ